MGQYEDTFYEIYQEVDKKGLRDKFYNQLDKMKHQDKHKYKSVKDHWEYAYKRITGEISDPV
jgi:hypothetical protein